VPEGTPVGSNGKSPALERVHQAEVELDAVVSEVAALQGRGRQLLGIAGRREQLPFVATLQASRSRGYDAVALWILAFADTVAAAALMAETPTLQAHLSPGALGPLTVLRPLMLGAGGAFALTVLAKTMSRPSAARWAAVTSAVGLVGAALSTSTTVVFVAAAVVEAASGMLAAVLLPMLFDRYRPELRVRMVAGYVGAVLFGVGLAELAATVGDGMGFTWRAVFVALAVVPLVAAALAARVQDPLVGRWDAKRVAHMVEAHLGGAGDEGSELSAVDVGLSFMQQIRRVVSVRSARPMLLPATVFGIVVWGFAPSLDVFLRDRWDLVSSSRVLASSALMLSTIPGVLWVAHRGESVYRDSPREFLLLASSTTLAAGTAFALAIVAPAFWLAALLLWLALTGFAALLLTTTFLWLALTDPPLRGHAAVVLGVVVVGGGIAGPQVVNTIANRFGIEWGMVLFVLQVPVPAAVLLARAAAGVDADVDQLVGRMIETHELRTRVSRGQHVPLLSCRNISFSYGQVQVLFDVSFSVDDSEMVALLGTNGAGKSTLLRLISGLDTPAAGAIHYRGADVTFLSSEQRVELGISQIPGGRAVFGSLTVMENLRAYGHTLGRHRSRLDARIDEACEALPRLDQRRDQLASTLSGGERQMLALAQAYLLQPRLLLIDELSLGLAPIVVGELLEMVRRINEVGTAVVLVEQSVNVALSVVNHAYFMEKGEIRFDGAAQELLDRPDLLRAVFLQGATEGLKAVAPR